MSDDYKSCTKCGQSKPIAMFAMKKRRTGYFPSSQCMECTRAEGRARWYRNGKPKQGWGKVPFEQWTPEMREALRKSKEAARRKSGMRSKAEIKKEREILKQKQHEEKAKRAAEREAQRKMPAGMTKAEIFCWRYKNDPEFREKAKKRACRTRARVPYWYANQQLGGTSARQYPPGLVFAKQMQLKINRYIKEQDHEKH